MRDKEFGTRIVPIIPDEARTFGMDAFFPTAKIYNPNGQNYLSVDRDLVLAYKESIAGPDRCTPASTRPAPWRPSPPPAPPTPPTANR